MTTIDTPEAFSREQLEALRDSLTMLDLYKARKLAPKGDAVEVGMHSYHQGALRTGMIPAGTSIEAFLVRLQMDDFNEMMGEARERPLSSGGGSDPASSSGMDTPPENS